MSIASVLCVYLLKARSKYYEGTDRLLKTLVLYTVNTGLLATFWSMGSVISVSLNPHSETSLTFYLSLSKVYVNAFLVSLNARDSLREKSLVAARSPRDDTVSHGSRLRSIAFAPRASYLISGNTEAQEGTGKVMAI